MTLNAAKPPVAPPRRVTATPATAPATAPKPKPPTPTTAAPKMPAPLVDVAHGFSLRPGPGDPWPLFGATIRNVLYAKKTLLLLAVMLIPLYVTWIIQAAAGMDHYEHNEYWGAPAPDATNGLLWFQDGAFGILFPFLIPLVVAAFAASAIGEEVEGKTLPYLFTRPLYRNWILLPKALGLMVGVYVVALIGLTIFWFGSVSLTESPFEHFGQLLGYYWVLALAIFASAGVFLFLGVLWRRSIIVIILFLFVWEFFLSQAPALFFKRFSIVNYERPILLEISGRLQTIEDIRVGFVSAGAAHVILLLMGILGTLAALYVVSNKDYNV